MGLPPVTFFGMVKKSVTLTILGRSPAILILCSRIKISSRHQSFRYGWNFGWKKSTPTFEVDAKEVAAPFEGAIFIVGKASSFPFNVKSFQASSRSAPSSTYGRASPILENMSLLLASKATSSSCGARISDHLSKEPAQLPYVALFVLPTHSTRASAESYYAFLAVLVQPFLPHDSLYDILLLQRQRHSSHPPSAAEPSDECH